MSPPSTTAPPFLPACETLSPRKRPIGRRPRGGGTRRG
jgi:hypothetical protein